MEFKNPELLKRFRTGGRCSVCGQACSVREPHHIFSRGAGWIDWDKNLIAVGSSILLTCPCHSLVHGGKIKRQTLLEIVCARDAGAWTPQEITEIVWAVRRMPKPLEPYTPAEFDELVEQFREANVEVNEYLARKYRL